MIKIGVKGLILLLILSITVSATLLTFDPTRASATVTLLHKNNEAFRWLYKRLTGSTYSIEVPVLNQHTISTNKCKNEQNCWTWCLADTTNQPAINMAQCAAANHCLDS